MKLYANVTSERATKGQGGNKRLDTEIYYGDKKNSIKACSIYIQANSDDTFTMTIIDNMNTPLLHTILKGKKQKDVFTPRNNSERDAVCPACNGKNPEGCTYC